MLAVWVEQLLGFASGALKAIRRDERYPALMTWAREQGPALVGGNLPMAQALAPELWSQTPLERLGFACEPLARPGRNEPCWCATPAARPSSAAGRCACPVRCPTT